MGTSHKAFTTSQMVSVADAVEPVGRGGEERQRQSLVWGGKVWEIPDLTWLFWTKWFDRTFPYSWSIQSRWWKNTSPGDNPEA